MSDQSNLYSLVMAGGSGTRFWPESTSKCPKQYLRLVGEHSLLTETLKRFDGLVPKERRLIVTIKQQEELAAQHSNGMVGDGALIFEPAARNTAPAILLSLAQLIKRGASENDVVAVVPADHVILNHNGFREVLTEAAQLAHQLDKLITIGITPNFPHTGYGYIQRGDQLSSGVNLVSSFCEKPDLETAKGYLASGEYLWNAGMFVGRVGRFLEEFKVCAPTIYEYFNPLIEALDSEEKLKSLYQQIPSDSVDYAVMERSEQVAVIAARFDWNDLGSWDALASVIEPVDNNVVAAARDHYFDQASNNIIYAPDHFVSLINVNDLIVVVSQGSLVVLPASDSQKIKEVVNYLKGHPLESELL
jgi:mannose-1-phosphate guanylyltransferase